MTSNKTITLSGGQFGGETILTKEFIDGKVSITDNDGNVWIYDATCSNIADSAEFVQFVLKSEVKQ